MDSDYIEDTLESLASWLTQEIGTTVHFNLQSVIATEPYVNLTMLGVENRGDGPFDVKFQLDIIGAGDGMATSLASTIAVNCKVNDLYNRYHHDGCSFADFTTIDGTNLRVLFLSTEDTTGQLKQNNMDENETQQQRYVYTEPYYINLTIPRQG